MYYLANGRWRKFDPAHVKKSYPGGCHFFGAMKHGDAIRLDRPEIRVASKCGQWRLAHWFEQAKSVGGNCHETITCIHANPELGDLKAGEMKEGRGWVRVRKEAIRTG